MSEKLKLRCSALPLAFKCAGSVRRGPLVIDERSDAADMGTAAHEGLANMVSAGRVDWESVGELAKRHGVDERELRILLALGQKLWDQVGASFPDAVPEVSMSHDDPEFELTGHADVLAHRAEDSASIADHKTGRKDADYSEQLKGYAALALLEDASLNDATAGVLWIRETEYEHYTMPRTELAPWLGRLRTQVVRWDGVFRPGSHCQHCPRNFECEAGKALARRDVSALLEEGAAERAIGELQPADLISLVERARTVSALAERFLKAAKSRVQNDGDVVASGRCLTLQHEQRRHLKVLPAFKVLQDSGFEDEDMAEVLTISASKVDEVVRGKAPRGKGAAAIRQINEALEGAGAVEVNTVTKLVSKRA